MNVNITYQESYVQIGGQIVSMSEPLVGFTRLFILITTYNGASANQNDW